MASLDFRPNGVPVAATFSSETHEWAYGPCDPQGERHGPWRFYDELGALARVANFDRGTLDGVARLYEGGRVVEQRHYVKGEVEGPYWKRLAPGDYPAHAASCEVGTFERGVRVGSVRLLDANDVEIARFELGRSALEDEILKVGVLSIFPRTMAAWLDLADRAFAERRNEEGLASLARAVAKGADPSVLLQGLQCAALPVSSEEARQRAHEVSEESSPRMLLGALVAGADPVEIFRRLAAVLGGNVALDMIEAAISIAHDPVPLLFTRGLLRVLSGNVVGARQDAKTLRYVRPTECELLTEAISAIDNDTMRVAS